MAEEAKTAHNDIRQEDEGWTVYNANTGKPVRLNDAPPPIRRGAQPSPA